jgi:hypothetical protein
MSAAEAGNTKQPDPTEKFRELRDAYLDIWSKNLIETVNSEGYAKASGAALDGILAVAAPFKEPTEQAMLKTLQQLNMPTSVDFAGLAGRFTNVELLLDNLDAKLDRIEKLLAGLKTATSEEPKVAKESATDGTDVNVATAISPEAAERAEAPRAARKTAPKKQTALRASGTAKRTTTVKPLRRNARKATR